MTSATPRPYQVVYDTDNGLQYVFETGNIIIPMGTNGITALTGDVTATGPGSAVATIANGVVTAAKLADHSITPVKISATGSDNFVFPGNITLNGSALKVGSGTFGAITSDTGQPLYLGTPSNTTLIQLGSNMEINVGNLGIHGNPDSSASLDVQSTTTGFLPPRMTTTQRNAIGTPAEGLIVYDTTLHALYEYQNGSWVALSTGGGGSAVVVAYYPSSADFNSVVSSGGNHIIDVSVTPKSSSSSFFLQATIYTQLPTSGDQTQFQLFADSTAVTIPQSVLNANTGRIDLIVPAQGWITPGTGSAIDFAIVGTALSGTDNYVGHVEIFITELAY